MTELKTNRPNMQEFRREFAGVTKALDQATGKVAGAAKALFQALKAEETDIEVLKTWARGTDKKRATIIMHEFLEENCVEYMDTLADMEKAKEDKQTEVKQVLDAKLRAIRNHAATVIMIALNVYMKGGDIEAPTKGVHKGRLLIGTPTEDDPTKLIYGIAPVNHALAGARKAFRGPKEANERQGTTLVQQQKALAEALKAVRELAPGMAYDQFATATRQLIVEAYAALEAIVDNDEQALKDLGKLEKQA
jgi:hypothetical protein